MGAHPPRILTSAQHLPVHHRLSTPTLSAFPQSRTPTPTSTSDGENVQPLHHPEQTALMAKNVNVASIPKGHSEMGGKALLAKKMAASGQSFYSPTDTMVSPCTAKLHLAKKKHFTKGKPLALSSSFATSNNNPLQPSSQNVPFSNAGFLHPSHAQ